MVEDVDLIGLARRDWLCECRRTKAEGEYAHFVKLCNHGYNVRKIMALAWCFFEDWFGIVKNPLRGCAEGSWGRVEG